MLRWQTPWWLLSLKNCLPKTRDPSCCWRNWPSFKKPRYLQFRQDLQPLPSCSFLGGMPYSRILDSSLNSWAQWERLASRDRTSWVQSPRYFRTESSVKPTGWLDYRWRLFRRPKNTRLTWKWLQLPRRANPGLLFSIVLDRQQQLLDRELWHRNSPFEVAPAGEPATDPTQINAAGLRSLLQLPQLGGVDGIQVGACLADFALHWRSLLGNCRATGIVEDRVGLTFQQRPQLTHQCISFRTRNSQQDLQQAVYALLLKGAMELVTNVASLRYYSRLFLVPKKMGDLSPVIDLSTLNRHMVVPHFKMETQGSIRAAIRSQEWTVSIDIRDAYLNVPMHQAVRKYLCFVVNKKVYQFTCLPFGLATSPRKFTKLLRPVVTMLRQWGVKLHVYLDDWLICADTPKQAQLHAQTTIRVLQFLSWIINFEKSDLTPSQEFQFIGMQFNTRQFTVAPLPKMRLKVQSVHQHWMTNPNITARNLHRLLGVLVFMASLVLRGRLRLRPVQWWVATTWCQRTGSWSNRITVPQWVLSEVAWWASPAVLHGLPLAAKETEVTLFTDASSSGLGAQLGSRSTQGQWSGSQRLWHINVLEMQAVINAVRDFLPQLRSRVVRLMCDSAVTVAYIKNEGGTRSYTLMQMTIRLLK